LLEHGRMEGIRGPSFYATVSEKAAFRGRNVGFIFQQHNLLPTLTVAENVAVPLLIQGAPRRSAIARAQEELAIVGLGDRTDDPPRRLSGGEQQRVAIARALVAEPRLFEAQARTDEASAVYQAAVLRAFAEVAGAMRAIAASAEVRGREREAVQAGERAFDLAQTGYQEGLADSLSVRDAQGALLEARRGLLHAERELLSGLVRLQKALGGGWSGGLKDV